MNVANNEDFKKNLKKLCVISQNFLLQGKMYNLLTKSYYCVMENTTVNAVNAAKTTLWQSNVSNLLNVYIVKYDDTFKFIQQLYHYKFKDFVVCFEFRCKMSI